MVRPLLALIVVILASCSSTPPVPEGIQDRKNRAADYLKFGRQAFQEAKYEQALAFYLIAVDLNTAVDYEAGMAAAWNSVATVQNAMGRLTESRAALTQAEALATASGDATLILQTAVNRIQADLSEGRWDEVRTRLKSLQPFPATAEGAALEHALGTLEKAQDHGVDALAAFDRALVLNNTLKLKQEAASNRYMKASVLGKLGRWEEARAELKAALELDKIMENTLGIGQDWRALGTVAAKLGQPQEAFDSYLRAYRLFQAAGLEDQQRKTLELLLPLTPTRATPEEIVRYQAQWDRLSSSQK